MSGSVLWIYSCFSPVQQSALDCRCLEANRDLCCRAPLHSSGPSPPRRSPKTSRRCWLRLHLRDLEMMVQRRVLQCYTKLVNVSPAGGTEALLQSNLLTLAISLLRTRIPTTPPNSLSASIAATAGTFETIWDVGDNSGFGVTGLCARLQCTRAAWPAGEFFGYYKPRGYFIQPVSRESHPVPCLRRA